MKETKTDEQRGYNDRLSGYYDKWYRYNRQDDGAEYDRGCRLARGNSECVGRCTFIESNTANK